MITSNVLSVIKIRTGETVLASVDRAGHRGMYQAVRHQAERRLSELLACGHFAAELRRSIPTGRYYIVILSASAPMAF